MKSILLYIFLTGLVILDGQSQSTVKDIDSNAYKTVKIGTQLWLSENLKTLHYNNGDLITNIKDNAIWSMEMEGARCYLDNDSVKNASVFGALYNWFAVSDPRRICPVGWHVPSNEDWNLLEIFLDNTVDTSSQSDRGTIIGELLKDTSRYFWKNGKGSNNSGFSALPGGFRYADGNHPQIYNYGFWWATNGDAFQQALRRSLSDESNTINSGFRPTRNAYSVRCISDIKLLSVKEMTAQRQVKIYPNPTNGAFQIDGLSQENITLYFYNILGECIKQIDVCNSSHFDISELPKGLYFIKIVGMNWSLNEKLIKN